MDHDTALDASIRAGDEAMSVGGPDEAAHHYQQALELLADPRRCPTRTSTCPSSSPTPPTHSPSSGHPGRAAALVQEQLGRLPADAPDAWRARLLATRASALISIETDEDPAELSAEAVRLLPPEASGLRAKVLAIHARILSSMGRYDEAQAAGLEALALAEKLELSDLASDAITTLSGLKRAGPKEGLREALVEAVARAEESGAVQAELRGRFLLGRSYQDWAEFDQAEKWFRSGHRARRRGRHPLGAVRRSTPRWHLAWLLDARGQWDEALALLDVTGQSAPRAGQGHAHGSAPAHRVGPGPDVTAELAALRRYWPLEGLVAIYAAALGIERAGHRGDAAAAVACYQDGVEVLTGIWHEWFVRPDPAGRDDSRRDRGCDADAVRRRAGVLRPGGRAPARRRPHGAPAPQGPVGLLGSRGTGLGQAARRRDAAVALAGGRRRAASRGPRPGLARDGAAVRRVRPRLLDRGRAHGPGRHPAGHRRRCRSA